MGSRIPAISNAKPLFRHVADIAAFCQRSILPSWKPDTEVPTRFNEGGQGKTCSLLYPESFSDLRVDT
jgi:hypothetical protein